MDGPKTSYRFFAAVAKGLGQVMLQENVLTGILFLLGICCGSLLMGLAALSAVAISTSWAWLLRYGPADALRGLYGFNAALVGIALLALFRSTPLIWGILPLGAIAATVLQHLFLTKKIPAFTFPFILVTWAILLLARCFPEAMPLKEAESMPVHSHWSYFFSKGFGQVMFQDNALSGWLFFLGVLVNRPFSAMYAAIGAVTSWVAAYMLAQPEDAIYMGLLSYNAVLCALVFVGKKPLAMAWTVISVILSVGIMVQMRTLGLPALTFPFVLATWIVLLMEKGKSVWVRKIRH